MPISLEAYNFNGTGSLSYPIGATAFGNSFTIETWIKNQGALHPDFASIAIRGNATAANGLHIYKNKLSYRSGESSGQGYVIEDFNIVNYPLKEWVHIALIVTDGKTFDFYRDFNKIASGTFPNNSISTVASINQGDWSINFGAPIDASLALTRIWTTSLSIATIQNNAKKFIESEDSLLYRLKYSNQNTFGGTVLKDNTFQIEVDGRAILENDDEYFSVSDGILIHLPNSSDENQILYGLEKRKNNRLDIPFTKHNFVNKTSVNKVFTQNVGDVNTLKIKEKEKEYAPIYTWYTTAMTSNTAPVSLVASASSEFDSTLQAWNAFSGLISAWCTISGQASNSFITLDFGSVKKVDCFSITPRGSAQLNQTPKIFDLQTSTDGQVFTTVQTFTFTEWSASIPSSFILNTSANNRYFRILIKENMGNTSFTGLDEIKFGYKREVK